MGILLTIAYDGGGYSGWQSQKNAVAVQDVIEGALDKVFECGFSLLGASRTDAGVHAIGQRAHLRLIAPSIIPIDKIPTVINAHLPHGIRIWGATAVPDSFHPINDCISKTYVYKIYNAPYRHPLLRGFSAFVHSYPAALNVDDMRAAARHFLGEHDFCGFCASGAVVSSTVRIVHSISIDQAGAHTQDNGLISITINGNGFLYNMVRIIAGTLVRVGCGKLCHDDIPGIIASKDRKLAGKTMPPEGLTLLEIFY